ncbi:MAG: carbohydrate-binding domain-containing protein [Oscillospiraceae bacterium]
MHANGNVTISGGTFAITTGDDGVHADETVTITDGTLDIPKCYEGIEGQTIDISGGTIDIVSSDDGLNAAGGADQSGFGGRGPDRFGGNSDSSIAISGGTIRINASGDGIDSNGDLNVSGGEIYVSGPMSDSDSALDYDSAATVTGGTVVAAGYSGMAQNFGANSTQGSILLTCQSASTETIRVTDASGNVLAEFAPAKAYTCVVVSTPALTQGSTCTVTMGGQSTNVTLESPHLRQRRYGRRHGRSARRQHGHPAGRHRRQHEHLLMATTAAAWARRLMATKAAIWARPGRRQRRSPRTINQLSFSLAK